MLNTFRELLSKEIDEISEQRKMQLNTQDAIPPVRENGSKPNATAVSPGENQLEIIRELLLNGDLPWWVDKNGFTGIDILCRC